MNGTMNIGTDRVIDALQYVPSDDRDCWVRMAFALKSTMDSEEAKTAWKWWSSSSASYNETDAETVWRSVKPSAGGPGIGTIFHYARENGWTPPRRAQSLPRRLNKRPVHSAQQVTQDSQKASPTTKTSEKVRRLIAKQNPCTGHTYLMRKKVAGCNMLGRIALSDAIQILGYAPRARGEPLEGELLVAPVTINGSIATAELIDGAGRKSAVAGGAKAGGFWATGELPADLQGDHTFLLAEGVATALSAHECTGHTALASLAISNLSAVAKSLREQYLNARIIVLAELSKETGEPDSRSAAAAISSSADLAVPDFGSDRPADAKDFNDLHVHRGPMAVVASINSAKRPVEVHESWDQPQPISATVEPEPFPLDAVPARIRAAVTEVAAFVQAPMPLVVSSALAAISVAVQSHVDVQRAVGLKGPVGLFFLTVADSGERKTSLDRHFTNRIRQYEQDQRELAKPVLKAYDADLSAWNAEREGCLAAIKEAARKGNPTEALRRNLQQLEEEKPEEPRYPQLLMMDETPESLAFRLAKKWPSGGIFSSEGGTVLGAHGMGKDTITRNLALQNVLWDGGTLSIGRKTSETFTLRNARLTTSLQVQESPLRHFLIKSEGLARGTGFLARFFFCCPASTQGTRLFQEAPEVWHALDAFNGRIGDLLEAEPPLDEDGQLDPATMTFAPNAKAAWIEFHDCIERELASGGELRDVRDCASKVADNAARLAALFQVFEHGLGPTVSLSAFEAAAPIAAWYLHESRRFFGELSAAPQQVAAVKLDEWLRDFCRRENTEVVPVAKVLQLGPSVTRAAEDLEYVMQVLSQAERAKWVVSGRRKSIAVNPALLRGARHES